MAGLLTSIGLIIGIIGWILIVVHAWKESSPLWGILCLILSPACLIYVIMNFGETWKYLAISIIGSVLQFTGMYMAVGAA